jgi:hypothetical protein
VDPPPFAAAEVPPRAPPVVPLDVTVSRDASPPPPLVAPPSGAVERRVPASSEPAVPAEPAGEPRREPESGSPPRRITPIEQTLLRDAEPPSTLVRGIPDDPFPAPQPREPRREVPPVRRSSPPAFVEVAAETPASGPGLHSFAEVLAEARRWVSATPAPEEAARVDAAALEVDAWAPAAALGTRPRRGAPGVVEASEEVHVSIGAITVTIEDPAAARPAPRAEAPRPPVDGRSRLARHYLRPE